MKQKNVGQNIRYYRNKLNLTQQELADKVGITWEMISRYEHSKSSPMERIDEIAQALDVSPAKLLSDLHEDNNTKGDFHEIPYFVKTPVNLDFQSAKLDTFYPAPTWMLKSDKALFAISSEIVEVKTVRVNKSGVFFISPSSKQKDSGFLLAKVNTKLIIDLAENINGKQEFAVLGKVIAQEVRF